MLQNGAHSVHDALFETAVLDAQHLFGLFVIELVDIGGEVVLGLPERRKAVPEVRAGAHDDVGDALVGKVSAPTQVRGSVAA
jgi:hypothetical protein